MMHDEQYQSYVEREVTEFADAICELMDTVGVKARSLDAETYAVALDAAKRRVHAAIVELFCPFVSN